jgi:hypothetical protein
VIRRPAARDRDFAADDRVGERHLPAFGRATGEADPARNGVGACDGVTLDLRSVPVASVLMFNPARLENTADTRGRLNVDGLTYPGLPVGISSR